MHKKFLILIVLIICSFSANAQYYDTLPKGVRMMFSRYIKSDVSSSYNQTQSETPYAYEIQTDIKTLETIEDERVKDVLNLFAEYPEAYNQINLGTHSMEGDASVEVNVFAFGYGITDRVMAYVGIPIYDARVNLRYQKTANGSEKQVAETLQSIYGDNWAQTLGNIVDKVYGIDGGTIQSGITNALGYEELGDWQAQGLGDVEFGLMYNFFRRDDYGFMVTFGGVAPTGYVDDPDVLQDIGFGDGQWDGFIEFGGGYVLDENLVFNAWTRYTHQFESERRMRVPYNEDLSISDTTADFYQKLGNRTDIGLSIDMFMSDWFKFTPQLMIQSTEKAKYYSPDERANEILAQNTDSYSQSLRLQGQLTSVRLYGQNKFVAPALINIAYQTMLEGRNTPKVDLIEVEFRMYF